MDGSQKICGPIVFSEVSVKTSDLRTRTDYSLTNCNSIYSRNVKMLPQNTPTVLIIFIWLDCLHYKVIPVKDIYRFFSVKHNVILQEVWQGREIKFHSVSQDIFRKRFPSQGQRYFQCYSFWIKANEIFWGLLILVNAVILLCLLNCGRNSEDTDIKRQDDVHWDDVWRAWSGLLTQVFQSRCQTKRQTGQSLEICFFKYICHFFNFIIFKPLSA